MKKFCLALALVCFVTVGMQQVRLQAGNVQLKTNLKGPKCVSCGTPLNEQGKCTNANCQAKR